MKHLTCGLVGVPVQTGASQAGCVMGPDSYRTAGLTDVIDSLGHTVIDMGNVAAKSAHPIQHENPELRNLAETIGWVDQLEAVAYEAAQAVDLPVFLGGDHSLSAGTVPGMARALAEQNRPLFVLWLDAHTDIHTLNTTQSGFLHGTPVAYFTGLSGFEDIYPPLKHPIDPARVCMMGIRSVDPAEKETLGAHDIKVHDMRALDETGFVAPLREFLAQVHAQNGALHVSLDVDFLDPQIAPAVGTTVPGGATFREAHLVMEMLHEAGCVCSMDLVELNPFLDDRGKTAKLMVDLCASLLGRRVLDRKTRSY